VDAVNRDRGIDSLKGLSNAAATGSTPPDVRMVTVVRGSGVNGI
jgi:hypothetical protein